MCKFMSLQSFCVFLRMTPSWKDSEDDFLISAVLMCAEETPQKEHAEELFFRLCIRPPFIAGPGPFPGLIDLYGSGGGLIEYRASLLASRGFVTLALAYMSFEDIPAMPKILELSYFEEAVNFLRKQQQVRDELWCSS